MHNRKRIKIAAGNISGDRVTIDYSRVDSDVTSNAARVPTLLAIGSSEFSRIEMRNIVETRTYPEKSASSLDEGHKYRLIYGQKGLDSTDSACNVQTSDKWSYEMNVQLSGSPEIVVDKELISGENGKKGSKYQISVRINFPDSYGYLDSETLSKLEKQVLDDLECEYSESNVKLDKKGSGQYELEVISEGETDLNFKYSRNEYGGGKTTASGQTTIESPDSSSDDGTGTGSGDGSGSGSGDGSGSGGSGKTDPGSGNTGGKDDDGSGSSIKNPNSGSSDRNKGITISSNKNYNSKDVKSSQKSYKGTSSKSKKSSSKSDADGNGSDASWQSADMDSSDNSVLSSDKDNGGAMLGAGLGILFCAGMASPMIDFYRNTYKGKSKSK